MKKALKGTRVSKPLLGFGLVAALSAGLAGIAVAEERAPGMVKFRDSFETDRGWTAFEENVGGNPCYGTGLGLVTRAPLARRGRSSLAVTANAAGSAQSDHMIGHRKVLARRLDGSATLDVWARQEAEVPGSVGETGPEVSIQSTRRHAESAFVTTVAGVQYLANPASPQYGTWQI